MATVLAMVAASLVLVAAPAGATEGAPSLGGDVPVICDSDTLDSPGTSSVFGAVWVPAGSSVNLVASGEMLPSFYVGNGRAEYLMYARIWDDGVARWENGNFYQAPINWGPGPYQWNQFSGVSLGTWQNNTGASKAFGVEIWAVRSFAGAGIHWSVDMAVPGGVTGSCNVAHPASEFFGPNAAMPGQCPCHGSTAYSVDTRTGNEHWELPGVTIGGRGPGLDFRIAHNSLDAAFDGPVGRGWRHSYDMALGANPDESRTVYQETGSTVTFVPDGGGGWVAPDRFDAGLIDNGDGTWTFERNRFEFFTFDAAGRLTGIADRNGYETALVYTNGLLDYVEDEAGRRLDFTWSGGRVASITDPLPAPAGPRTIVFTYSNSNLVSYRDIGGGLWAMTYDSAHRLTTVRSPRFSDNAKVREFHYDAQGRVDWEEDALNRRTSLYYNDPVANATRIVAPDGDQQVDWYNGLGQRTKITRGYGTPQATSTEFAYDADTSMVVSRTDDRDNEWIYGYDDPVNPHQATSVIDPLGRTRSTTYNALGQVVTSTDGEGVHTTFGYDTNGNLEAITAADGTPDEVVTDLVYGDPSHPGDVTATIDGRGKQWSATYDPDTGDRLSLTDPEGNKTSWAYNQIGWVTATVAPAGNALGGIADQHRTHLEHNRYGDPTRLTNPADELTVTGYDLNRNITSVTDPDGDVTQRTYTDADQLATETVGAGTPAAATTTFTYWPDGNLKSWAKGSSVWSSSYDAVGRQVTATDPNGRVTAYRYDGTDNLVAVTQPGGNCTATPGTACVRYSYDDANQLTSVDYTDPATPDITQITYDDNGRRLTHTLTGGGTSTWAWTPRGELAAHTDGAGQTVEYDWDNTGNLDTILYPGQVVPVDYGYDDAGRMTTVSDWLGNTTAFGYDPNSNLTTTTYPSDTGTVDAYTYDDANRVATINWNRTPIGSLGSIIYGRDVDGLVTSAATTGVPAGPAAFDYDTRDQLRSDGTGTYRYDTADNLTATPRAIQGFDPASQLQYTHRAVTVVGATKTFNITSATVNQALPAGIKADDQILVVATVPSDQSITTPPAGYTLLTQRVATGGPRTVVYRRAATGGETTATIAFSGLGTYAKTVMAIVYRGVDPTNPVAGTASNAVASPASSITVGSLTLDRPGTRLVMIEAATGNLLPSTFTHPAGMTNQVDVSDQLQITTAIGDQTLLTAGPTGDRTATYSGNRPLVGIVVAFNPERHTYTYDTRGNRTSRTTPFETTTYNWDQANRLVAVDGAPGYAYDGDGLRVRATIDGQTRRYTWSQAGGLPLMLTETPVAANGTLLTDDTVAYIYGPGGRLLNRIDPRPAISLVGTGAASGVAGNTVTVDLPAGITADDQILLAVTHNTSNSTTATTPPGYTQVGSWAGPSSRTRLWRRTATGGENTVTVTFSNALAVKAAVAVVYRGVDPTNPIVDQGAGTAQSTTVTVPSLTPATVGDRLVAFAGAVHLLPGDTTWTPPPGMTQQAHTAANTVSASAADQPLTTTSSTGDRMFTYGTTASLTGVGVILRRVPPPERWHHADHLGSTRIITDEGGDIIGTATYDPYGQPTATTGQQSRIGFAGEYTDPTDGLIYLRARWYDPTTGQFLNRDPLEPITRTPHAYAANSPLNYTDPSGLNKCEVGLNPLRWGGNAQACADDAWDATGGRAATWVKENPKDALVYTAIGLGGTALIIGTAGVAAPAGLTVFGVSSGTIATGLGAGSTLASVGVAYADCRRGWSAECAASAAEALGGAATTGFGAAAITATRSGLRIASGSLGFVFDLAALCSPKGY